MVIIKVVLPAPFGPEQAGDLPLRGGEVDALQRFDVAIGGGNVADLEEGLGQDGPPPPDPGASPLPASSERPR